MLLLLPFGAGLLTLRVVIVIEGGWGIGDGDGDFLDRSTGWASAMSTCSSMRRGEGAFMGLDEGPGGEATDEVECGDWKYRCTLSWWSMGGEDTGRPFGVGVLRWLPDVVVVVMTLAEFANGELARILAANGQPAGDGDMDEEEAGLLRLALKSAAVSRLM